MRRTIRVAVGIVLPAILILAGVLILTGCFYVPAFNATYKGINVAAKVGDAQSRRPIRVGLATRDQIISLFGKPPYSDTTGQRIGYAWMVKRGIWIYPLCFNGSDEVGTRGIELQFDQHDILKGFKVVVFDPPGGPPLWETEDPGLSPIQRPPFDQSLHPNDGDLRPQHRLH